MDTVIMLSVASSGIKDPRIATRTVFAKLDLPALAGVLVFCSNGGAPQQIAAETLRQPPGCTIIGCTTAGEITAEGLADGSISAIGFPIDDFTLKATRFDNLDEFDPVGVKLAVERLVVESRAESARLGDRLYRVALLLIDGLSHREELFAHALQNCLGPMPLIGGSAGDGLAFRQTAVLHDGTFRADCAVLAILTSRWPMKPFCRRYGVPGTKRAIVTRVDPVARRVFELNGENAALEYARLVGVSQRELNPGLFALHPLMVHVAGQYYARSIQSVEDDGSLVFQSAISRGLVTRLGGLEDIAHSLTEVVTALKAEIENIHTLLAFDDVLNWTGAVRVGAAERLKRLYADSGIIGFRTYGEQFRELHLNQSIVGVALGGKAKC